MIKEYEKSLVENYVLYLVPQAEMIKFASGDEAFYRDDQYIKYPAVLVNREDNQPQFCDRYDLVDDETGEIIAAWPYDQPYTIKVYVEKQTEAIAIRNQMRIAYAKDPYIRFELDGTPVAIGVRLLQIEITSDRDNYDNKGARRVVEFTMQSRLVLTTTMDQVAIIKKVQVSVQDGQKIAKAIYTIDEEKVGFFTKLKKLLGI